MPEAGHRLPAALERLLRWEFWPAWALYAPLLPALAGLALRHRSMTAFTAANPGIPTGGLVGESKGEILRVLPPELTAPAVVIPPGPISERLRVLDASAEPGPYPIILKPDVGERGAGVRLARSREAAAAYLEVHPGRTLAQRYHPGPHEVGVFYTRHPDEARGSIFSITEKVFPRITGDGRRTLRQHILDHPRFRLQAALFLRRLGPAADRTPAAGESVPLAIAGNHRQGTMFLDGAHLITPALEAAIDRAARAVPGFHFGRFDIRYGDPAYLAAGHRFCIVELNGVGAESTNIYDPSTPFLAAQRTLRRQWARAFEIGDALRRRGAPVTPLRTLLRLAVRHSRRPHADPDSD
jgi:hypothetical protein